MFDHDGRVGIAPSSFLEEYTAITEAENDVTVLGNWSKFGISDEYGLASATAGFKYV